MRTAPRKPTPFFLATESRPELRARARSALDKSDPSLEADCTVEMGENTQPAVRLIHRPTGLQASVEPRRDRDRTRLVALVQLRDALYDLIQGRSRHPPRKLKKR
jgi:hypothetical protein